jgi:hypothetical protein
MENNLTIGRGSLFPLTAVIPICKRLFGFMPQEDDLFDTAREVIAEVGSMGLQTKVMWHLKVEDHHVALGFDAGLVDEVSLSQGVPAAAQQQQGSYVVGTGLQHPQPQLLSDNTLVGSEASQQTELAARLITDQPALTQTKPQGKYVVFHRNGQELMLPALAEGYVDVVYTMDSFSDDGQPRVHAAVLQALAFKLNANDKQVRYFMGTIPENMYVNAQNAYEKAATNARMQGGLTDQGMAKVLKVLHSSGRFSFGNPDTRLF